MVGKTIGGSFQRSASCDGRRGRGGGCLGRCCCGGGGGGGVLLAQAIAVEFESMILTFCGMAGKLWAYETSSPILSCDAVA
jgi:hypothetical protein